MSDAIYDTILIGSGMGALTTATLLAQQGTKVLVLEQNYLPGGCTSSYWRKGFVFEAGATTLIGLDKGMPLFELLKKTGIHLDKIQLEVPMQVTLKDGQTLTRFQDLNQWITEAESVFSKSGQRPFWETCYKITKSVWEISSTQTSFPPENFSDLVQMSKRVSWQQIKSLPYAFISTQDLIKKYGLDQNRSFCEFIDEQLIITAQNNRHEVNALFGATSLCYTNFGNYYLKGGLINLVTPFIDFIKAKGGELHFREKVTHVEYNNGFYYVQTNKNTYKAKNIVSGIPLNNTLDIYPAINSQHIRSKLLPATELNSAFQVGLAFRTEKPITCLHHQIHLEKPIKGLNSKSIFLSLSHPNDESRSDEPGITVGSVSTHLSLPQHSILDKNALREQILNILIENGFFQKEDLLYSHASDQLDWEKWTNRKWGFVGGYPQSISRKPWTMPGARLDGKRAYICGDSVYPGQGIPGVVLSGIIAYEKMKLDGNI
jgi:C-3',4' desaturase CrtD